METIKEIGAFIGALAGLITALAPVFAYFLGRNKRASAVDVEEVRAEAVVAPPEAAVFTCGQCGKKLKAKADLWGKRIKCPQCGQTLQVPHPGEAVLPPVSSPLRRPATAARPAGERADGGPGGREDARKLVRGPALAMLAMGCVGLFANLFMAGFGYVDEYVKPLATSTKKDREVEEAARKTLAQKGSDAEAEKALREVADRRGSAVAAIVMLLTFSLASGVTVWAAYNMLHLRNYWLAVFGSVSVMPGACLCCFLGIPSGTWSLTVLVREEVRNAFH